MQLNNMIFNSGKEFYNKELEIFITKDNEVKIRDVISNIIYDCLVDNISPVELKEIENEFYANISQYNYIVTPKIIISTETIQKN